MSAIRYLYVEDNEPLRETICSLIEGPGRQVTACATAEDAMAEMAQRPFDVLVTDVSLPGTSGTVLARHWLKTDRTRWVVFCSGYELKSGLSSLGPNVRALPKSFELPELEALLAEVEDALRQPVR